MTCRGGCSRRCPASAIAGGPRPTQTRRSDDATKALLVSARAMIIEPGEPLTWCVVANVAAETNTGDRGLEIRSGLRRFGSGARCSPAEAGHGSR